MYTYNATLDRVVDGDTYDFIVDCGFKISHHTRIRLANLDTPETFRPRNAIERRHGQIATEFVKLALANAPLQIRTGKDTGKYGRWIGDVIIIIGDQHPLKAPNVPLQAVSLGDLLIHYNLIKWPDEDYRATEESGLRKLDVIEADSFLPYDLLPPAIRTCSVAIDIAADDASLVLDAAVDKFKTRFKLTAPVAAIEKKLEPGTMADSSGASIIAAITAKILAI